MNFDLQPEIEEYRSKVRAFVNEHIIPLENDRANYDHHENIAPDVLLKIQKQVKQAGLWAPQMPKERGGLGFDQIGMAASYEEMNRSILALYALIAVHLMMEICLFSIKLPPKNKKTNGCNL